MNKLIVLMLAALLLVPALAAAKPTGAEVKNVLDYFESGSEAVLTDVQFCTSIASDGPNKNQCVDKLDPKAIPAGKKVYLWANLLVPKQTASNLYFFFAMQGRTLLTTKVNLAESMTFFSWTEIPTDKNGEWTVSIDQEKGGDFLNLGKASFTVK